MNLYLYGYGRDGARDWLIVDMGVTFGSEAEPGIDIILPDISFIEEERHNIAGLLLTHAHEDHFGAVIDLWPLLANVPVYATPFTAEMLKSKLAEMGLVNGFPLQVMPLGGSPHHRPVRRRADQHVAFDPRAVRGGDPHAARRRTSHRRLEARRQSADQRADRRRPAEGAGRGRAHGADLRFHQCRARRRLAVRSRRGGDARPAHPRGAAAGGGHHLRLQCRAHRLRGQGRPRRRPRAGGRRPRHVPRHRGGAGDRLSRPRSSFPRGDRPRQAAAAQSGGAVHRQPRRSRAPPWRASPKASIPTSSSRRGTG